MEPKDEHEFKHEEHQANPEFNLAQRHRQLERGLKSRHIQFLALGMKFVCFISLTTPVTDI
jgi:amino acid transporter